MKCNIIGVSAFAIIFCRNLLCSLDSQDNFAGLEAFTQNCCLFFSSGFICLLICITIVTFGATKMEDMLNLGDVALSEHVHFSYVLSVISMVTCVVAAASLVLDIKNN